MLDARDRSARTSSLYHRLPLNPDASDGRARLKGTRRRTDIRIMEPPAPARAPERPEDRQICCSMTSVLLRTVRSVAGEDGVRAMLAHAGSPHDVAFLERT